MLSSRRGSIRLPARVTEHVPAGMVFVPFHWGDLHHPDNATNYLTISATGRIAKQPELKFCAVNIEKCPPLSQTPLPQLLFAPDSAQTRQGASTPVATESI